MKKSLLVLAAVALSAPAFAVIGVTADLSPKALDLGGASSTFAGIIVPFDRDPGTVQWSDHFTFEMAASGSFIGDPPLKDPCSGHLIVS